MVNPPEGFTPSVAAAAQLRVAGGIPLDDGAANNTEQHVIRPEALAARLSEADFGLKKGYMRVLMQFADDSDTAMATWNDDIDAESVRSSGEHERQRHGLLQEPSVTSTTPVGVTRVTSANDGLGLAAGIQVSSRISRVPYTWQPGETLDLQDGASAPNLATESSPPDLDPQMLDDVFQPLNLVGSDDLSLQLPGLRPPVDQPDTNMTTMSMTLAPVKEEETNSIGITISNFDSFEELGSASSSSGRPHHPSISMGRPSTSTTHSSSSMSTGSSTDGTRNLVGGSSPRRPASIFSRFRKGGGLAADEQRDFLERRSLTPHELVTRLPRRESESDRPLPPLPPSEFGDDLVETSPGVITISRDKGKPVFGIDLDESIKLAPMRIRISHRGSSTSHRSFPLSVYKCCEFIQKSGNADPRVFSSPGDAYNVSQLQDVFNTPPYGEGFDFNAPENRHYSLYDAGRLILLYLQALPKPLVSPSVVKGWVMLARQEGAIEPPAPRPIESGLDFWAEALNRLPVANRNLTKHLLTLFAESVTSRNGKGQRDIGEADARNLAAAVSRAFFHLDDGGGAKGNTKNVHATLALAFLIRKRGDYLRSLGGREDGAFLPSTREMMEWKG
ncbi:hypothetical protein QBC47DRAFT_96227 [Echria macrotheca]|uniref:Rho-GAP domain-containing protein n=1 Tax=Echria macrotheca TaxID=438768 RepID=A0AAJ0BL20_9PEZI|nr:hypothetical protein QBC47DRAFT_96227 [Echria macrotheca]